MFLSRKRKMRINRINRVKIFLSLNKLRCIDDFRHGAATVKRRFPALCSPENCLDRVFLSANSMKNKVTGLVSCNKVTRK
jgi:hypothetical protein